MLIIVYTVEKSCKYFLGSLCNTLNIFLLQIEVELENALRKAIVQSLDELAKVVSPEAKTLNPLFKTMSLLHKSSNHVKIFPSLQVIFN